MTKLNRYEYSLLDTVQSLHMASNGSGDYVIGYIKEMRCAVQERIDNWIPSRVVDKLYDDTVLELCQIALLETDGLV